jgi:hypothetical protein
MQEEMHPAKAISVKIYEEIEGDITMVAEDITDYLTY